VLVQGYLNEEIGFSSAKKFTIGRCYPVQEAGAIAGKGEGYPRDF
jgi:hypothetical protein